MTAPVPAAGRRAIAANVAAFGRISLPPRHPAGGPGRAAQAAQDSRVGPAGLAAPAADPLAVPETRAASGAAR